MTDWYLSKNKTIGNCDKLEYVSCKTHNCNPKVNPFI